MHQQGIVHSDLKSSNVMLAEDQGSVKIIDFGLARFSAVSQTSTQTSAGSPSWLAPELFAGGSRNEASDVE